MSEADRVEVALRRWLFNFTSARTRTTYRQAIRQFAEFVGLQAWDALVRIEPDHAIAWRDALIRAGGRPRTVAARLAALSSLYRHLASEQIVRTNPFDNIRRPRVDGRRVETVALDRRQVRRLLDAPDARTLKGQRARAVLATLFYTGCRVSEPGALRVRDLHADQGYTVLDFQVKGGKSNRLAIHPELERTLRSYLAQAGHAEQPECFLLQPLQGPPRRDRALSHDTVNRIFKAYARKIALPPHLSVHTARATFITQALQNGHPVEAVQHSVAHASVTTTLAYDKRAQDPSKSASFAVNYAV